MASDKTKEGLKPAGGGGAGFLSAETYEKIRKLLAYADLVPDPSQFEVVERAGKKHFRYRAAGDPANGPAGGAAGATGGTAFCEIYTDAGDSFIRGGVVFCGDKNFNVPGHEINLAVSGDYLVYLEFDCEANRDDDGELILSGILTSAETTPASFWQTDAYSPSPPTQYPDNTNPTVSTGIGTIIIPLGRLIITGGAATFSPVACGNVTVNQCAGVLSHTRS